MTVSLAAVLANGGDLGSVETLNSSASGCAESLADSVEAATLADPGHAPDDEHDHDEDAVAAAVHDSNETVAEMAEPTNDDSEPAPPAPVAAETEADAEPIPAHLQGLLHWQAQRKQWLSRPCVPDYEPQEQAPNVSPERYAYVYHRMVRECCPLSRGQRLNLAVAIKLIIVGWKEDGLLPPSFVTAPPSPPLVPTVNPYADRSTANGDAAAAAAGGAHGYTGIVGATLTTLWSMLTPTTRR
ncbi:hypothetical protein H9P43_000448 [Blastocladiella emersonii ATCC 22665]|nr:hypothetical protein H9P43_000448 [Blastocladiella emersonii ATCC 22665]